MADDEELVQLLLRADWTTLCLSAELITFHDHEAWQQLIESATSAGPQRSRRPDPAAWGTAADEDADRMVEADAAARMRSRLVIAPGGRFRQEYGAQTGSGPVLGSDGQARWDTAGDDDEDRYDLSWPPCEELLLPAWLPSRFALGRPEPAAFGDRRVLRVAATPRPLLRGHSGLDRNALLAVLPRPVPGRLDRMLDRVDVLVDAETGILLRCERAFGGQVISRSELRNVTFDPLEAVDPSSFAPPAGPGGSATAADDGGSQTRAPHASPLTGPGWQLLKTAANMGASALGARIRNHQPGPAQSSHAPRKVAGGPDPDEPELDGSWIDAPIAEQTTWLIYRSGLQRVALNAEIHTWLDTWPALAAMKGAAERWGMNGVGQLSEAMGARGTQRSQRMQLGYGGPLRYRIDYAEDTAHPRGPLTVAVDGEHRWRIYPDRATVGPAVPLPTDIARLLDPAWLLGYRLTGGQEVRFDGRRAFAVRLHETGEPLDDEGSQPEVMDAIIDAELGILLRFCRVLEGKQVSIAELRETRTGAEYTAADFRIDIPADRHVVKETGGILDEIAVPPAVRVAADVARRAYTAAAATRGIAERLFRG